MDSSLQKYRVNNSSSKKIIDQYKRSNNVNEAGDIAKQGAIGLAEGLGGTYGGLLDLIHANPENAFTEREQENVLKESLASPEDLINIESETLVPEGTGKISNFQDINDLFKMLGIETNPETASGQIAKSGTRALGSAASLGANPLNMFLAAAGGASGETLRELGAPDWLATSVDLGISGADLFRGIGKIALSKQAVKKPSGLTARKFENLEKPTSVTASTKANAIEATKNEFQTLSEKIREKSNDLQKTFRTDPGLEKDIGDAFTNLRESAGKYAEPISSKSYTKNLADEYAKIGKKGFEKTDIERNIAKSLKDSIADIHNKEFTFGELIDQYRKNNGELKKYLPYGPGAVENEAKREVLLAKNRAIANVIEKDFSHLPESNEFKFLNDQWRDIQRIKTVDKFVDSIFSNGKIDYKKAQKALYDSKTSRSLENALGKEQFNAFKKLSSDLLEQEKAMKLLKTNGMTLEDLGETGAAFILKPKLGKLRLGADYVSKLWRRGLADPKFTRDWSKSIELFQKGKVPAALAIIDRLSQEIED